MKVLITGGSGFLGSRLARTLLMRGLSGKKLHELVLLDLVAPPADLSRNALVSTRTGALTDLCMDLTRERFHAVFHLASAVSGECEADLDLGLRFNLDSTRALLDALRAAGGSPMFIFASSVAVFGSDPGLPMPLVIRDDTLPTPQSSYGIQKFICEQLVTDYTRRNLIDGRTARLMTVSVRPGKPNRAASGFLSGIIREPLAGKEAICPVPLETSVAIASPASAIDGLIAVAEAKVEALGGRTAVNLPALTVRVADMLDALEAEAGSSVRDLVRLEPDDAIAKIVQGWPSAFDTVRANRLGLQADKDFRSVIGQYVADQSSQT